MKKILTTVFVALGIRNQVETPRKDGSNSQSSNIPKEMILMEEL